MSDLELPGLGGGFDPFADAKQDDSSKAVAATDDAVHIRIQQRNGKK